MSLYFFNFVRPQKNIETMKDLIYNILGIIVPLLGVLTGCQDVDLDRTEQKQKEREVYSVISEEEALEIASRVVCPDQTRSSELGMPKIQYLSTHQCTRSGGIGGVDTISYIINYAGDTGFAIIFKKKIMRPVLAYAETGSFSLENECARENFLNIVPEYLKNCDAIEASGWTPIYPPQQPTCSRCYPVLQFNLDQTSPWNKYTQNLGGGYAGCGPVVLGYALTHCKDDVAYHGVTYDMAGLRESLHIYQYGNYAENIIPKYTQTWSEDVMAKLLWQIGQDVHAKYKSEGTSCSVDSMYIFCKVNNLEVGPNYTPFDSIGIVKDILDDRLIMMYGINTNKQSAHEWVIDGCDYCTDHAGGYWDLYLHCNWGWGGYGNGYFSGDVFSPYSGRAYNPTHYFSVYFGEANLLSYPPVD